MDSLLKRLFDVSFSIVGILVLLPLMLVICLLIKIHMPGPIFFKQRRVGRFGNPFVIVKFRTMVMNTDPNTISVKGDCRITKLGAKLRKYKLDELPELWNVLKGDMSFVGPRPDMPEYLKKLKGDDKKILELRPGITGPATLVFANEEELLSKEQNPIRYNDEVIWPKKVQLNLDYYYNRNFLMDIQIIFKTIFKLT